MRNRPYLLSTDARNASMPSGRLSRSSRGELAAPDGVGDRSFENPLYGLDTRPIEPSNNAANSTGDSFITPSTIGGHKMLLQLLVTQFRGMQALRLPRHSSLLL